MELFDIVLNSIMLFRTDTMIEFVENLGPGADQASKILKVKKNDMVLDISE